MAYKLLPIEQRCVHKFWKARLNGYEESMNIFREINDEKSPEWNKYIDLIKNFVIDKHQMCRKRGLKATLVFVEKCANATSIVGDVVSGIISKCIASRKTEIRELSVQVILLFIEMEKQEDVVEELFKGMGQKNPKIVAACTATICKALKEFGSKIINLKPIVKNLVPLLVNRDKTVREEGKRLIVEILRWTTGFALKSQITAILFYTSTKLEIEFEKQKTNKPIPIRFIRSHQTQTAAFGAGETGADDVDFDDVDLDDVDDDDNNSDDSDDEAYNWAICTICERKEQEKRDGIKVCFGADVSHWCKLKCLKADIRAERKKNETSRVKKTFNNIFG